MDSSALHQMVDQFDMEDINQIGRRARGLATGTESTICSVAEPEKPYAYAALWLKRCFGEHQEFLLTMFRDGLIEKSLPIRLAGLLADSQVGRDDEAFVSACQQFLQQCLHVAGYANVEICMLKDAEENWLNWCQVIPVVIVPQRVGSVPQATEAVVAYGAAMLGGPTPSPPERPSNWPKKAEPWPVYFARALSWVQHQTQMDERSRLEPKDVAGAPLPAGATTDRKLFGDVLIRLLDHKTVHGQGQYLNTSNSAWSGYLGVEGHEARAALAALAVATAEYAAAQAAVSAALSSNQPATHVQAAAARLSAAEAMLTLARSQADGKAQVLHEERQVGSELAREDLHLHQAATYVLAHIAASAEQHLHDEALISVDLFLRRFGDQTYVEDSTLAERIAAAIADPRAALIKSAALGDVTTTRWFRYLDQACLWPAISEALATPCA